MAKDKEPTEKDDSKEPKVDWLKVNGQESTVDEFCSWILEQKTDHPVVKQHHGKWKELIEWEKGNQFSIWDPNSGDTGAIVPVKLNVRKLALVINLMKPLVETIEGKVNFYNKKAGMPNSTEQKDIQGAQVASRLIEYNDYLNFEEDLMEELKYDLFRTGNACKKWTFDKSAPAYMAPKKNGKPDKESKQKVSGDVRGEVVPIFNIRPDTTAKDMKDCRWMIEFKEVTVDDIVAAYGVRSEELRRENESKTDNTGQKYEGMNEDKDEKDLSEPTRILAELWERPSKTYKNGRFVVVDVDDALVLHAQANPNPNGQLPYFMYYYKKSKYSFWAMGPLHFIQDIQRSYNRTISITAEHIEAWRPKMAVGSGALKRAGSMTVDSFEIVEVDFSKGEPRPMQMPELSPQVMAFREFLRSSIDDVSNIHEVSYSRLPQYASRAPASLYAMLLEQENTKMGPAVAKWNKTIVEEAQFRLRLMDKYYDVPRMVKIMGPNKKSSIDYFSSADLNENFDVRLEIGITLNQSSTIQLRTLIEFKEKGIITDNNKIIRAANLGMAEQEFRTDVADMERAIRENQCFMDGTTDKLRKFKLPPAVQQTFNQLGILEGDTEVYIHDDHALHLEQHTTLLKSEDAMGWPDTKFDALDRHVMVHLAYQQMLMQAATPQQAPSLPAPGQPGAQPGAAGGGQPGPTPEEAPGMGANIEGGMEAPPQI